MSQQQEKFILAYQLLDNTVSYASRSLTVVNETNEFYLNLVAKIQVYMLNKNQKLKLFFITSKIGIVLNMLNFMAIV